MDLPGWVPIGDIKKISSILEVAGESRLVGGCVRNIISNADATDIDMATQVLPEQAMQLLEAGNVKCVPTGIKHGTITAIIDRRHYEITTLRRDVEGYGRHASIAYTNDWPEDSDRRDFTINAMYLDMQGKLYDYHGGQEDLAQKLVRFVGDPQTRIAEDYLRILRYFRFYAYLGGARIDLLSLAACKSNAKNLSRLSGMRIQTEMLKLLGTRFAIESLVLMHGNCVLEAMGLIIKDQRLWQLSLCNDATVNLAILIRHCADPRDTVKSIKEGWQLSNKLYATLDFLVHLPFDVEAATHRQQRLLYEHGIVRYNLGVILLRVEHREEINARQLIAKAAELIIPDFPVGSHDLKQLGYTGKDLGGGLKLLERLWLESGLTLTKEELLERIIF